MLEEPSSVVFMWLKRCSLLLSLFFALVLSAQLLDTSLELVIRNIRVMAMASRILVMQQKGRIMNAGLGSAHLAAALMFPSHLNSAELISPRRAWLKNHLLPGFFLLD